MSWSPSAPSSLFHGSLQFQPLRELLLWPTGDENSVLIMSPSTSTWRDETKDTVFAVNMVHMVCPWDKALNYDWEFPLTQVPPALALHTHSCPGSYCPLRSSQTKCTNIKLVSALNHITVSLNNDFIKVNLKKKNFHFKVHPLPPSLLHPKQGCITERGLKTIFWLLSKFALSIQPK